MAFATLAHSAFTRELLSASVADRVNKITIVITPCEEGGFSAQIKEIPGAISQGETEREAVENVGDALVQVLAAHAEEALKDRKSDEAPLEIELALASSE
jgi:predicted RNase H-like HicB family nuclease